MKRNRDIEAYVKCFTGIDIKVYVYKKLSKNVGARITQDGQFHIRESCQESKPLIWHEMGHLMTVGKYFVEEEVSAQTWAFKELERRGYKLILRSSIAWVRDRWGRTGALNDVGYAEASKILMKSWRDKYVK